MTEQIGVMVAHKPLMPLPTVGDIIPDRCCTGHNWTVLDVTQFSVWGVCGNPQCPEVCCPDDPECPYNRMRTISVEDWTEEEEE